MNPLVQAESLSRFYGPVLGLNNVSFALGPGLTGIVGSNGAGKTTLFRLLTGQIRPSAGSLRVFGAEPWNNPSVCSRIGYCPEGEALPAGLDSEAWLGGLALLSGLDPAGARRRVGECLERVRLAPEHRRKPLNSLSKGMRQRVKLAQALLHQPDLLIFDEPMNGLDPMGREDFGRVLRELGQEGKAVVISSHLMQDLESLCSEFILLRWGRIPRSLNEALSPQARRSWPEATLFRCSEPARLARHLLDEGLVRGWDLGPEEDRLLVRWADPERFFGDLPAILLRSGASIREMRQADSALQRAMEAPAP